MTSIHVTNTLISVQGYDAMECVLEGYKIDTDKIFYYIMILFKQFYSLKHDPPVNQRVTTSNTVFTWI